MGAHTDDEIMEFVLSRRGVHRHNDVNDSLINNNNNNNISNNITDHDHQNNNITDRYTITDNHLFIDPINENYNCLLNHMFDDTLITTETTIPTTHLNNTLSGTPTISIGTFTANESVISRNRKSVVDKTKSEQSKLNKEKEKPKTVNTNARMRSVGTAAGGRGGGEDPLMAHRPRRNSFTKKNKKCQQLDIPPELR